MVPAAFQQLYDDAERCLKRAIEVSNRVFSVVVIIFFYIPVYRYWCRYLFAFMVLNLESVLRSRLEPSHLT